MNVLFVNSVEPACGVHQFGLNLWRVLAGGTPAVRHRRDACATTFYYTAPEDFDHLLAVIKTASDMPRPDILLYNFYPCTMQWVSLQTLTYIRTMGLKQVTIFHEVPVTGFDALIYPDPTRGTVEPLNVEPRTLNGALPYQSRQLNDWYAMGRALPLALEDGRWKMEDSNRAGVVTPVIGTSGFGFTYKGHARVVQQVCREFERATVRVHLPFATHGDIEGNGARSIAADCLACARHYPGIHVEIDHAFLPPEEYVAWLAANDLNAFIYDDGGQGRGIASTTDHALAARRPIAINRNLMFRHLHGVRPSICVEDRSLKEILASGITPLRPIYERFSDDVVRAEVEGILTAIWKPTLSKAEILSAVQSGGAATGYCRLLTDADRAALAPVITEMFAAAPEMMGRKISEANVQQAWCLDVVRRCLGMKGTLNLEPSNLEPRTNEISPFKVQSSEFNGSTVSSRVLCVGCFEDTACEVLSRENRPIGFLTGIDPDVQTFHSMPGLDLAAFRRYKPDERFGCVFACSVLEHVGDDEQFIRDLCDCLIPDGVGILTCDFQAAYQPGDPLPATNVRFYTPADIERLRNILTERGCYWLDEPDLRGEPDFVYQGHHYSFAGLVFKKL